VVDRSYVARPFTPQCRKWRFSSVVSGELRLDGKFRPAQDVKDRSVMHAAHAVRRPFQTFDYEADTGLIEPDTDVMEADTDLIVPLTRRVCAASFLSAKRVLAAPPTPMIVDKDQLVRLAGVLRVVPKTIPGRIPRLSTMVRDERTARQRRARERVWLARIGVLAVMGFVMFIVTRPVCSALMHQSCVALGGCVVAR
jgi:hypothetical protein